MALTYALYLGYSPLNDRGGATLMLNSQRGLPESCDRKERGETPICQIFSRVPSQNNSQSLAFLAPALGAFMFGASICEGAEPAQGATEPTRPTKEWQTSSPEELGMDSKEPARLVDFGTNTQSRQPAGRAARKDCRRGILRPLRCGHSSHDELRHQGNHQYFDGDRIQGWLAG